MLKKSFYLLVVIGILCGYFSFAWGADKGEILSGETRSSIITGPSFMDAFQFYGEAGDRIIITAVTTSGPLNTEIYLYPPDSGPCEADTYPFGDKLDHQLEQSGLYTAIVQDHNLNDEGEYNISLTKIPSILRAGLYNPYPPQGVSIVGTTGSFGWDPVEIATGYDLYFGKDVLKPLEKIGHDLSSPSMAFPEMEAGNVYYWHVVAHTPDKDIEGPYWWFFYSSSICDGDVNGDGEITPMDALCAFETYLEICPTSCDIPCEDVCCDVTQDDDCTPADALCIFQKYLGLPSCLD